MRARFNLKLTLLALLLAAGHWLCAWAGASSADAVWPEDSGVMVVGSGKLQIDASNLQDGYVMCRVSEPTGNRLKLRVTLDKFQLTYNLNNRGEYEVFPLQLGDGTYEFALYENAGGDKYASEGKLTVGVQLENPDAPLLVPNQYVDYVRDTPAVLKSDELAGMGDIYRAVCDFMSGEFEYDYVLAQNIGPGELPDIDACFEHRMGICQDLSAVMVCMLRVQGIPAKLVIGYADSHYHAWVVALMNGKEVFFDPTAAINAINVKSYTTERFY